MHQAPHRGLEIERPNPAGSVDAPITRLFAFECQWQARH